MPPKPFAIVEASARIRSSVRDITCLENVRTVPASLAFDGISKNAPAAATTPGVAENCPTGNPGALCIAKTLSHGNCSKSPSSIIAFAPPMPSSAG